MPSVRVKRSGGRPYTVVESSPAARSASLRPESPASVPVSQPGERAEAPVQPTTNTATTRRRRGTVVSLFGRNSAAPPRGETSLSVPEPQGDGPRNLTVDDTDDWRNSLVMDHVMKGRQRAQSRAGRSTERLPTARDGRTSAQSVRSQGNDVPSVNIRLSQDDMEGNVGSMLSLPRGEWDNYKNYDAHHHDEIVDHLDVIDPQVSIATYLSNAANSIILPPLSIYSRRPVLNLPSLLEEDGEKGQYKDDLDRHVNNVLRRRDKLKRFLRGFLAFVTTPIGFCTALYGFLCAFWGAAIVIFLAKIINLHDPDLQNFWVEISSQVTNGLFTATGVGLIPWRVIDTYRMGKILYYKDLTRKLRAKNKLEDLVDEDDLPDPMYNPDYVHVLNEKQQDELRYQQQKFMQSQTWYRPHATETHKAFPIGTALLICILIDFNSIFQILLCGCMWGLNRFQRPAWTTGSLIPASFSCALGAVFFIYRGGAKSKKTQQVEDKLREALQLENEGLMNAHVEERDGFMIIQKDTNTDPPPDAQTMVIPHAQPIVPESEEQSNVKDEKPLPDLEAVPSGPVSRADTREATKSRKAPVLP